MKKNLILLISISICLIICSCGSQTSNENALETDDLAEAVKGQGQAATLDNVSQKNILQIAIGSKDHSTLVAAVQAAQLENVLSNNGPLTVFAPNNAAFDALPAGTVENLLKPENKKTLSKIIKHHAAPGSYDEAKLKDGSKLFMATGYYLDVENKGGVIKVGGAEILGTVFTANGIVHVVNSVLLPPDKK